MEEIVKAAEKAQEIQDKNAASNPNIKKMMDIVHKFIQHEKVMCYGGTAINNILPLKKRFYDPEVDIPDYDFFSENPQKLATKLCNLLKKAGLENIEAKHGVHLGTYKVFCEYIGVADITHMESDLFNRLWKDSLERDKIHYVPPDFLKMNVYLELSRPMGDASRWKKVYGRLQLLDEEYPTKCPTSHTELNKSLNSHQKKGIEELLIREKVVLLGFNASSLQEDKQHWELPLDILVEEKDVQKVTKEFLDIFGRGSVRARSYEEYEELLPAHTDIVEGSTLLVRVYETMACHSYHELSSGLHIGSIPTLLNFFFAMLYADEEFTEHTTRQRVICAAQRLVEMANNKKERRFELLTPTTCLGHQQSLIDMRKDTAEKYEKAKKDKKLFHKYFFTYKP